MPKLYQATRISESSFLDSVHAGVLREAPVNELRGEPANDGYGNVALVYFFKFKSNLPVYRDACKKIAVGFWRRGAGVGGFFRQSRSHGASSPNDPAGQDAAVRLPVRRIENIRHVIVGMALQDIHILVRFVLRARKVRVNAPAAIRSRGRFVHAVARGNTFRQRFMHAYDDGMNLRICFIASENLFEPGKLCLVELVGSGVVEIDEVHSILDPVVISAKKVVERI